MADATPRAVLCDLDDTLFDHQHATQQALASLREREAGLAAWTLAELVSRHNEVLERLHRDVLTGALSIDAARLARFTHLLELAGAADVPVRAAAAAAHYRAAYETGWQAVAGAADLLAALGRAGVPVVVVTNNGVAEQRRKLDCCGLSSRIAALVTSEEVGVSKPEAEIFRVALGHAGVEAGEAVMLGDSWTADVRGALAAGIRPVWFNRAGIPVPERGIESVEELRALTPLDTALAALLGRVPAGR